MWTFWRNKLKPLVIGVALAACLSPALRATPIDRITFSFQSSNGQFTAGVSTTSTPPVPGPGDSLFFIQCFRNTNQPPDENGEVITIELVEGGQVVQGGMAAASFTISSGVITYGGENQPVPLRFFHAGNGMTLRITSSILGATPVSPPVVSVVPGPATKVLALAPGEARDLGRDLALPGYTGKTGTPAVREPGEPFTLTIIKTDDWFNKVTSPPVPTISFFADDSLVTLPPGGPLTGGEQDFNNFTITAARKTVSITASATAPSLTSSIVGIPMGGPEKETIYPYPSPFNPRTSGAMHFKFRLNEDAGVALIVKDRFGQDVWRTEFNGVRGSNDMVTWDGRNQNGHIVAAGVYYALLEVGGEIKSKKQFGVTK